MQKIDDMRVLVAMSGGVDSSVAALALLEAGYGVEGVTMKLFQNEVTGLCYDATCCSLKDAEDARQVCLELGIPHFVYNFSSRFNEYVIEPFCESYLRGETPNPCVECNKHLKFKSLQERRCQLGYDFVATGHYARRRKNDKTGRYELLRARDANKDQSYVLFHLDQDTLAHMLFPLGELTKTEVRSIAAAHGFANANKPESQDICFVPDGDYASFIIGRTGKSFEPGDIVNRDGKRLGTHNGLARYTIGQRKGIGVAAAEPLYVYAKDVERNELVVDTAANTLCAGVYVREVNFISQPALSEPWRLMVKTHYRQQAIPAWVEQLDENRVSMRFEKPQRACASGQFAVAYDGDVVVCGGTIDGMLG